MMEWIDVVNSGHWYFQIPELVIIDTRIYGATVEQIITRLREIALFDRTAIIVITAYHPFPTEDRNRLYELGADLFMLKPLPKFNELKSLLEKLVEQKHDDFLSSN